MGEISAFLQLLRAFLDTINIFLIQMRLLRNELTCFVPFRAQNRDTGVIKSQNTHCFEKSVLPPVSSHRLAFTFCSHLLLCEKFPW